MATPLDLLILGGGIQALALLRELSDDYMTLLVGDSPRFSETLHFHGYFSSGWNAANLDAAKVYRRTADDWRKVLASFELAPHQTSFHAALPPQAAASLEPNWKHAKISAVEEPFPKPFVLKGLPEHRTFRFGDDLVFNGAAAFQRLRNPVADQTRIGRAVGFKRAGDRIAQVTVRLGDKSFELKPAMVLAACGAGNARVLELLKVPARSVRGAQVARPLHMVLARGPRLPRVSGFLLDLVVVHHPLSERDGLWIVTLNPAKPRFTAGVVDMARDPEVEPALVRASINKLAAVVPGFADLAAGCQWDVYVGWKTDAPGGNPEALLKLEHAKPYHVDNFGIKNFLAVWPNHWCLATPAAKEAGQVVRETLKHDSDPPRLPAKVAPDPDAAKMKWDRSDRRWQSWAEFAKKYGIRH